MIYFHFPGGGTSQKIACVVHRWGNENGSIRSSLSQDLLQHNHSGAVTPASTQFSDIQRNPHRGRSLIGSRRS